MTRTTFENLRVYQLAEQLADRIWDIVARWGDFARRTVGEQLVDAADSIGANIAEGAGRATFKENCRFVVIARGSLYETKHFLRRAFRRRLLTVENVSALKPILNELAPRLNGYLNSLRHRQPVKAPSQRESTQPSNNQEPPTINNEQLTTNN
jgi:four helix bundle protein